MKGSLVMIIGYVWNVLEEIMSLAWEFTRLKVLVTRPIFKERCALVKKSNYGVTCEDEAKRRNSGAKTKTFEENFYLLLYAISSKEDTAYQRQLITRIRVKDKFPISRITHHIYVTPRKLTLYAVCTSLHTAYPGDFQTL
ncbi:hypothetical protein Tco_0663052 [Tanacetum coccineum]